MDALLGQCFDGVESLRRQWERALVESSCECGCGSIAFVFVEPPPCAPDATRHRVPVEAEIVDERDEIVGGVIVFVRDGVLDDVDVYSVVEEPQPFPDLASIRWCVEPPPWRRTAMS